MFWMIATAVAAPPKPWKVEPYWQPRANIRAISVNGRATAQARGGLEGGLRYNHAPVENGNRGKLDLVGRSRLRGDILWGVLTNSFGFDARLGSFIGPTSKYVTYQVGPDVWGNMFGRPGAADYHLPFAMGLDISNTVIFHVIPQVNASVGIIPGWAFTKNRQTRPIGPFHEISGFATVNVRVKGFNVTVGYQRTYNAAGVTDGLILSGGL